MTITFEGRALFSIELNVGAVVSLKDAHHLAGIVVLAVAYLSECRQLGFTVNTKLALRDVRCRFQLRLLS